MIRRFMLEVGAGLLFACIVGLVLWALLGGRHK